MADQIFYLIECFVSTAPVLYMGHRGVSDFCSNPDHAFKFITRKQAENELAKMPNISGMLRVAEHMWCDGPNLD